jgi:hypothetical protein
LSGRQQGLQPPDTLHPGVPAHLDQPLRAWIYRALSGGGAQLVAVRLEISIDYERVGGDARNFLALDPQPDELLDVEDAILHEGGPWAEPNPWDRQGANTNHRGLHQLRSDLPLILDKGRSLYRVNDNGDGLTERVPAASAAAFRAAMSAAGQAANTGSAAELLKIAWDTVFALHPDSSKAYGHAIKAVEAAGAAIIQPNQSKATLGTMIRQLRDHPQDYSLAIPGPSGTGEVAPLIEMMDLLWKGQTSRHGAQMPTPMETRQEAEMAVLLAVTLVHWLTTRAVRRSP